ncbi:dihydroxyacetone phosphate acyltransferase-like isoform X2 [Mya arenaria]|uniref:dihydroxyacetone phosphate acyltransferase-like isoform X2 n=1 Tax=Mya arenaria TaxID=6604 RepID=UPI0022DF426A|nr:dihydroxyacetone phosphate acyltransferase-like isoform X2 [Mya arenaria]
MSMRRRYKMRPSRDCKRGGIQKGPYKGRYTSLQTLIKGLYKVRAMLKDYPILLMPSHRSYLDFLLMSYVFYHYDLPLPVIAAAMDFMGMKFFGWLLRNSGAFYIRRSFGDDQLYWAVFTEYVQTHICNGDSPIEFYVEGTRSRTQKSLPPRIGMLSASLEPYFKANVPDIMVVPISISYDRVLEERLYAYELLGVPKPKESASGVFKARSILSEDFGNVHIFIGAPRSIRTFSVSEVDRTAHSTSPRYIASLTIQEQALVHKLSYDVTLQQIRNMAISPWSIIAAVLLQNMDGIPLKQLLKEVEWLKRQASNLGAYIDWPVNESGEAVLKHNIYIHKNIARLSADHIVELIADDSAAQQSDDHLMTSAAMEMMVCLYRNQLLNVFVRVALITIPINSCDKETLPISELRSQYSLLEKLLNREFIFMPSQTNQDFEMALASLTNTCGVVIENESVLIKKSTNKYTTFFSQMFEPFLMGYWVMCRYLLSMQSGAHGKPLVKLPKAISKEAQILSARLLREGHLKHKEILSLDMMNNSLHALYHLGAIHKEKRQGASYMYPNLMVLSRITEDISKFIEVPPLPQTTINMETKTVTVNAKL